MKHIIITADDFGSCAEVNRAVHEAHAKGVLTCASLMVSGRAAVEAVQIARQNPTLQVGLHLVLTDGYSVLSRRDIPGLVDEMKRFPARIVYNGARAFFSKTLQRQIARECRAQIETFMDTGLPLDHLNSHNHLHIHPAIVDIILPLVQAYKIPAVRLPRQTHGPVGLTPIMTTAVMSPWVLRLRRKLIRAGIHFNQNLFGLHETGAMTEAAWLRIIPRLRQGITEVYCHPAMRRTPLLRKKMPSYRNEEEFAALLSTRVREALEARQVIRTSFGALATRTAIQSHDVQGAH